MKSIYDALLVRDVIAKEMALKVILLEEENKLKADNGSLQVAKLELNDVPMSRLCLKPSAKVTVKKSETSSDESV